MSLKKTPTNNNGMQTKAWGPPSWDFLFFCAQGYPEKITYSRDDQCRKRAMRSQLKNLAYTLPCRLCRESYRTFIKEPDTKIRNHLDSRESVLRLIYNLHNKVNKKLCIPKCKWPSFETVKAFYEQFRAGCCSNETFGCRTPGEQNPSVYANITYEPRNNDTNYYKRIPLDVDENTLNIECINHILYGDNVQRNFEYYKQLNSKYKDILDTLLANNNLQIELSGESLKIVQLRR
tara:strand:- start:67 stop:768 length:702 start_codon:yes stop_codon:yes gene_type:complete